MQKEPEPTWSDALTLDGWVELMIREGHEVIVTDMMKLLPEASKVRYREVWKATKLAMREEKV